MENGEKSEVPSDSLVVYADRPIKARKTVPGVKSQIKGRLPVGYMCRDCMIIFNVGEDYAEHNLVFHDPRESTGSYVCSTCGRLFKRNVDLLEHQQDHESAATLDLLEFSESARKKFGRRPKQNAKKKSPLKKVRSEDLAGPSEDPKKASKRKAKSPTLPKKKIKKETMESQKFQPLSVGVMRKELSRQSSSDSSATLSPAVIGGTLSQCPRCQMQFQNAWIMLDHATSDHGARLTRLEKRIFAPESEEVKEIHIYENTPDCPFCELKFSEDFLCLLHIVREHRNGKGLYTSPEWAGKVMVTTDVMYRPEDDAAELRFKINVTLKVKKQAK